MATAMTHLLLTLLGPLSTLSHAAVQARRLGSWRGFQWVGGNAWECRSQARHFCNLAFPGLKQRSPRERTLPGRKRVLSTGTQPVNVNLVKITTCLEIQGTAAKMKGATDFCRGPRDFFTVPTTLNHTLTPLIMVSDDHLPPQTFALP